MTAPYDHLLKFVVLGDANVGKTSVERRFADNRFEEVSPSTIGVDFRTRLVQYDRYTLKILLWDTTSPTSNIVIPAACFRGACGILLVYDITDASSFENVKRWLREADDKAPEDACRLLVGNKSDLDAQRQVDTQTAKEFADSLCIPFVETSAKTGVNVDEAFMKLTADIVSRLGTQGPEQADHAV